MDILPLKKGSKNFHSNFSRQVRAVKVLVASHSLPGVKSRVMVDAAIAAVVDVVFVDVVFVGVCWCGDRGVFLWLL